jgi:two-component system sensor histidine kinase RegB
MAGIFDAFKIDIFNDAPGMRPRHIRAATLIAIRWVAITGQLVTVLTVRFWLDFDLPLTFCLISILASCILNLHLTRKYRNARQMKRRDANFSLRFDAVQLAFLLGLTGGLYNPFSMLILAPVTVSAAILPVRHTIRTGVLVAILVSLLTVVHVELPGPAPDLASIYGVAAWVATLVGLIFIAGYVARVAAEQRRMMQALHAVEATLRREQQVSAVGALAAAAAHELGTPLATITLVAKELSREIPEDTETGKDIALLVSQSERCRSILADLTARPGEDENDTGARFYPINFSALLEEIAEERKPAEISFSILKRPIAGDAGVEPRVLRSPELVNGITNILANALQFARKEVSIIVAWSAKNVSLTVVDDGPGFASDLLERIGDPYISTRKNKDGHMGLGLFIARTLLENSGARLTFGNRSGAGAEITASWSRSDLEAELKD